MNFKLFKTLKNSKLYPSKFIYIAPISAIIALSSLTSCNPEMANEETKKEDNQETIQVQDNTQDTKIFEPGQHLMFIKASYNFGPTGAMVIDNPVYPDGYRILNVQKDQLYSSIIIFYINDVPVKCVPDEYGNYASFGTPVENYTLKREKPSN